MCILYLLLYLTSVLYQCIETDSALFTKPQDSRKSYTIVAKNKEFVEDIKEELRQNNDDYLESSSLTPTPALVREKETWKDGRRALDKGSSSPTTTTSSTTKTYPGLAPSLSPSPVDSSSEESSITEEREKSADNIGKQSKIYIGKVRLGQQSSKSTGDRRLGNRSPSTGSRKVENATTQKHVILKAHSIAHKRKLKNLLQSLVKEGAPNLRPAEVYERPEPRARPAARSELALSRERPPDSQQLDMAPAQGGRVDRMRIKSRLCQRNVLVPEGPKYDSQGRVYLKAYSPRGRALDYARTRPRTFLLPRCCNCCKKSVLGCE